MYQYNNYIKNNNFRFILTINTFMGFLYCAFITVLHTTTLTEVKQQQQKTEQQYYY